MSKVNTQGQIVGYYCTDRDMYHGLLVNNGTLLPIDYPDSDFTKLTGINNLSLIVGYYASSTTGPYHGFVRDQQNFVKIDFLRAVSTIPHAIDSKGDVVGSYVDSPNDYHGFVLIRSSD